MALVSIQGVRNRHKACRDFLTQSTDAGSYYCSKDEAMSSAHDKLLLQGDGIIDHIGVSTLEFVNSHAELVEDATDTYL